MTIFEQASRLKVRFASQRGLITVEDLWDLRLKELDTIAIELGKELKDSDEESFLEPKTKDQELALKFEIAKHVIQVRLKERNEAKAALERKAEKERLLQILDRKKDEVLEGLSAEELQERIAAL